ncbi:MAG: 6-phosphofructokinase [Candidatus Omnitrophica bacterium]|nr:6-phosphofructokinase [Candidatus Omnitrophota bacterium]
MVYKEKKLGILVGGGPAPGINGVIGSATMEALNNGLEVIGIYDGFKWLSQGDTGHVKKLSIADVIKTRFDGGSILNTSRENPTKSQDKMKNVVEALKNLGIGYLVTIGGDDTCFSASQTSKAVGDRIRVAHVPKTIDNDLPLPAGMPTFGFQTARHVGAELVANLVEDARTTHRWYLVVAMGRTAGHLALGMGISGGAALTIVPEEFGHKPTIDEICSIIECSIYKAKALGQDYGVVVIAEGVGDLLKEELKDNPLVVVEYDEHGHFRMAEVPLCLIIKRALNQRFRDRGEKAQFIDITIGYELRCARPVPFDVEYTHKLGFGAVRYLLDMLDGGYKTGAMISIQTEKIVPIPFDKILNPETGKTAVRNLDIASDLYRTARRMMVRVEKEDFDNQSILEKIAQAAKMPAEEFKKKYEFIAR